MTDDKTTPSTEEARMQLRDAALAFLRAGLSILPCQLPDKSPCTRLLPKGSWKPFMREPATDVQAAAWFDADDESVAVGIIGGAVSGNLEIIDFDDRDKVKPWRELVRAQAPDLSRKLIAETTLRGGVHVFYRCTEPVEGNLKLAYGMRPTDKGEVRKTLIETRGEGGYVVTAPSPGYELAKPAATQDQVQTITPEERDVLLAAARSLDESPARAITEPAMRSDSRDDGNRPGDEFNRDPAMLATLLESHSWQRCHTHGETTYWRRPGKEKGGISATWNHIPGKFHVFSSNAHPLESETTYSPFAVYAFLECDGDFAEASRRLRSTGYGVKDPMPDRISEEPPLPDDVTPPPRRTNLAVVPDPDPAPSFVRFSRDDPDWEPGMDDPDDDEPVEPRSQEIEIPRPPDGYPHILERTIVETALGSEQGLGKLASLLFRNRLLFDHAAKAWYRWGGHYWTECRIDEHIAELDRLQDLIRSTAVRKRPKAPPTKGNDGKPTKPPGSALFESLMTASDSLRKLRMREQVLKFAASGEDGLGITGNEWDKETEFLLACANGVVDLRTGNLRPGHPTDRLRIICPTDYDPAARAPRFEQFIREIMPDAETAAFMHRLFGYCVTGSIEEHVFPVFWGEVGRNGKDTLLETIRFVLGPLAGPISAKSLMAQSYQTEHDSAMLDMQGRRVVWASESGDRQALDPAKVKSWTGGGTLKGRAPYGEHQVEFVPTHKLLLITNFKPKLSADDQAMWSRMLLIPFLETFVDEPKGDHQHKKDRSLPATLRGEAKGVLRWLVEGCLKWQDGGLQCPPAVRGATDGYQSEEDVLGLFLRDCVIARPESHVPFKALYERYCSWCELSGEGKPLGTKGFSGAMKAKGRESGRTGSGKIFPGIELAEVAP